MYFTGSQTLTTINKPDFSVTTQVLFEKDIRKKSSINDIYYCV